MINVKFVPQWANSIVKALGISYSELESRLSDQDKRELKRAQAFFMRALLNLKIEGNLYVNYDMKDLTTQDAATAALGNAYSDDDNVDKLFAESLDIVHIDSAQVVYVIHDQGKTDNVKQFTKRLLEQLANCEGETIAYNSRLFYQYINLDLDK